MVVPNTTRPQDAPLPDSPADRFEVVRVMAHAIRAISIPADALVATCMDATLLLDMRAGCVGAGQKLDQIVDAIDERVSKP